MEIVPQHLGVSENIPWLMIIIPKLSFPFRVCPMVSTIIPIVSENVVYPIVPNGFHDHYPYEKLLFHWEY